ncbi:MAG: LamG domain-containing protein, partial [Candidatus Nanohaloarchaea archaeon]|nr:LamG domain-containing protein [Candidatus Nanohaloarchaea archaeon]
MPWKLLLERFEKRTLTVLLLLTVVTAGLTVAATNGFLQSDADDLVAQYRFEEGGGTTAYDTAEDNDGTLHNFNFDADSGWKDGKFGEALEFDGNNDYVELNQDIASVDSSHSVSIWINTDDISSSQFFFSFRPIMIVQANLNYDTKGEMSLYDTSTYRYIGDVPPANTWTHVVWTYEDATNRWYAYKNGEQVNTWTQDVSSGSGSDNPVIGDYKTGGGNIPFDGKIDNVRIYSRALNQSEVKALYRRGGFSVGQQEATASGKVLDIGFTRKNSTHVFDTAGTPNHGEPQNGASQETSVHCKVGRCYSFDGDNDYVKAGVSGTKTSVMFWANNRSGGWTHYTNVSGTWYR